MRTIWLILIMSLIAIPTDAVVITCVNEGSNVVRIDYSASDETVLPRAFALDVTVDGGAIIKNIYGYKVGDSNAASPGYGIFPATMQFDDNGKVTGWGTPEVNTTTGATGVLGGVGTAGVTLAMASSYNGTLNAPLVKGTLCRILVDPHGAQTVNVKVAANAAAGGVVLENASAAKFSAVGCVLGAAGQPPPPPPPPPPTTSNAFQQDSTENGIVSIETEDFENNIAANGHTWDLVTTPTGYSGTGAMRAMPNNGANINTGYVTNSPRLDFKVNFVKTGRHYIWVRCYAASNNDNTLHIGLNGQAIASSDRISVSSRNRWAWTRATIDGTRASFRMTKMGINTVNVWMREDGLCIDKIVLTTSSSYTPTGFGPQESPRGSQQTTSTK